MQASNVYLHFYGERVEDDSPYFCLKPANPDAENLWEILSNPYGSFADLHESQIAALQRWGWTGTIRKSGDPLDKARPIQDFRMKY